MEPAHLLATSVSPVLQGRSAATSTNGPHLLPPAKPHPRGILAAHHTQPVGDTDRDGEAAAASGKPRPQRGSAKLPSGSQSLESLPHLAPSATKAGKYRKLVEFDRHVLQRPTAHFRNALKTTQQIEAVKEQLQKDLHRLESSRDQPTQALDRELARLSIYRTAFDAIVPLTGPYAAALGKVKEEYDERVERALARRRALSAVPLARDQQQSPSGGTESRQRQRKLQELRKEVSEAEEKYQDLLQENGRLQKEFAEEVEVHTAEMQHLAEPLPEPDLYEGRPLTAEVEGLQMELAELQERQTGEVERRKSMVPIQVYRQQEQRLRDILAEKRKLKAQNDLLQQQIESAKSELEASLTEANINPETITELWSALEERFASGSQQNAQNESLSPAEQLTS